MTTRRLLIALVSLAAGGVVLWLVLGVLRPADESPREPAHTGAAEAARPEASAPTFPGADALRPVASAIAGLAAEAAPPSAPAAAPHEVDAATLQLEVVHADGAPAGGSPLVIGLGDTVLGHGVTDRRGRLAVPALAQAATLYVAGATSAVHTQPIEAGSGSRRIVLPDGAALFGWVTIQGETPGNRVVALSVGSRRATAKVELASPILAAFPDPVMDWGERPGPLRQRVTGDGAFAFSGLSAGEMVSLLLPAGYFLAGGGREFDIAVPATGVRVDLVHGPAVRGRAVWFDTRQPVAGCRVVYRLESEPVRPPRPGTPGDTWAQSTSGTRTLQTLFAADEEGRFAIPLHDHALSLSLWLADPDDRALADVALDGADIEEGKDLGDVLLRPARTITFRVLDEQGQAIEGALATVARGQEMRSKKTGADGTSELTGLSASPAVLTFWAAEREARRVTSPGPADEHLEVILAGCASLEVRVVPLSGALPSGLQVCLSASQQAYTGDEDFGPEEMRYQLGAGFASEIAIDSDASTTPPTLQGVIYYDVFEDGVVRISCLRPAVSLTLSVTDGQRVRVWGEQIVTLGRGEARVIEAAVPGTMEK